MDKQAETQIATQTSVRTDRSAQDTVERIEEQGSSLAEIRTAVDCVLLSVLIE